MADKRMDTGIVEVVASRDGVVVSVRRGGGDIVSTDNVLVELSPDLVS
jgi:biotin carboxyl carrier protein